MADTWHIQELRPFGDGPAPRRRVGCALIGTEVLVCGGTSPVKILKDGKEMEILHDNNEMYILQLCKLLVNIVGVYLHVHLQKFLSLLMAIRPNYDLVKHHII